MNIASYVRSIMDNPQLGLVADPHNRTHHFDLNNEDPEHWENREAIALEFCRQMEEAYPTKLITLTHHVNGPGSYHIKVLIK